MRARFEGYLNGVGGRDPALIIVSERLAARVSNISLQQMQSDAAHWAASQSKLSALLGIDAVTMGGDWTLAAEALGAVVSWVNDEPVLNSAPETLAIDKLSTSARQANAVEALSRLCISERDKAGCIAVMTGPVTLSKQLYGDGMGGLDAVKPKILELAESLCESRPDILVMREAAALGRSDVGMPQRKAFNTLRNVASYYGVPLALFLEDYDPLILPQMEKLKLPYLWLGNDLSGNKPDTRVVGEMARDLEGLGLPVDIESGCGTSDATVWAEADGIENYLLMNPKEFSPDADFELLRNLVDGVRGASAGF